MGSALQSSLLDTAQFCIQWQLPGAPPARVRPAAVPENLSSKFCSGGLASADRMALKDGAGGGRGKSQQKEIVVVGARILICPSNLSIKF